MTQLPIRAADNADVGTPLPIIVWIAVVLAAYSLDHRNLDMRPHERGVTLQFIRPGKPLGNACIESRSGRIHDECLGLHWHCRSLTRGAGSSSGRSTTTAPSWTSVSLVEPRWSSSNGCSPK